MACAFLCILVHVFGNVFQSYISDEVSPVARAHAAPHDRAACGHNHHPVGARSHSQCARSLPSVLSGRSRGEAGWPPPGSSIAGSSLGHAAKHSKPKSGGRMYVVSSEYLRQLRPTFAKKFN